MRSKKDSSLAVLARMTGRKAQQPLDAMISACNTGACVTAAQLNLQRLRGVHRPGVAVTVPTFTGPVILIDVGANLEQRVKGEGAGDDSFDPARYFAHAGRIIQENGANIVKTYYCENFDRVRTGIQTPIVMAGGKKIPEDEALELTYNAINDGVDGVDMGRNIFQADDPVAMLQAVRAVVHEGCTPAEAYERYQDLKKG